MAYRSSSSLSSPSSLKRSCAYEVGPPGWGIFILFSPRVVGAISAAARDILLLYVWGALGGWVTSAVAEVVVYLACEYLGRVVLLLFYVRE